MTCLFYFYVISKTEKALQRKVFRFLFSKRNQEKTAKKNCSSSSSFFVSSKSYLFRAMEISTATATVAPTMGLLPIPIRPIISTWAGTEEEPAN